MAGYPAAPVVNFDVFDKILYVPPTSKPPCCLKIMELKASPEKIKPSMDETTLITGDIYSNYPITWELSIDGRTISGSGKTASYMWNGKNGDVPVSPGVYPATLVARSSDGTTTFIETASVPVTVVEPPNLCRFNAPFGSTVNVASGNLSVSQEVVATTGSALPTAVSLAYNSLDTSVGSLGLSWRLNYDTVLEPTGKGGMVLREGGSRRVFIWSGTLYEAQTGDTATLIKNPDSTHDFSYPDGRNYHFAADGRIAGIADRFNNTLAFSYTGADLTSITESGQRTTTFAYDSAVNPHRLTTITDPSCNVYKMHYRDNRLWKVENPATDTGVAASYWEYTYNSDGLLWTKKDPASNLVTYEYFPDLRAKSAIDPNLQTRAMTYPTGGAIRTSTLTEKDQSQWTYTYDNSSGHLTEKAPLNGPKTTYYYYADATLKAKTEPFDGAKRLTTFYTYDSKGNLLTQTDPVDISIYTPAIDPASVDVAGLANLSPPIKTALRYTYDAAHDYEIASVTDERQTPFLVTSYAYSAENGMEVVTVKGPGNAATISRRNPDGAIKEVVDANNTVIAVDGTVTEKPGAKKTAYTYYPDTAENRSAGSVGLLRTTTMPDGVVTTYGSYDKNGNPLKVTVSDTAGKVRVTTVNKYDALNRLRMVAETTADIPAIVTRYDYDDLGSMTVTDAEQRNTKYEYNYQGQVKRVTRYKDGAPIETVYEYGTAGCPSCGGGVDKLTKVVDAKQQATTFKYDQLGRLDRETDPLGKVVRYAYYDNGLVKEKYDATGGDPGTLLVSYLYNHRGQVTDKIYTDGRTDHFGYRPDGSLETASTTIAGKTIASYSYAYHDDGRLKSVTDTTSGRAVGYELYDALGQKKQVTVLKGAGADERVIGYEYDEANRPWKITSKAGTFIYHYDNLGRRDTLEYPNGTLADYSFDDLGRLTGITHKAAGGSAFAAYTYPVLDGLGNRETAVRNGTEWTHTYDDLYRLWQTRSGAFLEEFLYDPVGNRTLGPGAKDKGYAHDSANRMTQGRKLSYGYDNAGNQATRIVPGTTDKSWTQTWDNENRLVKVEKVKGAERKTVTFSYDPFGRRIGKRMSVVKDGVTKTSSWSYAYDDDNIVLEVYTDENGTATKTFYTHGPETDEHLAMERSGLFFYYHADGLGSIVSVTDQSKKVAQSYEYDSFGMIKASSTFVNSFTYTGREWDKETGLYYYNARYYDPMEGRFISKDPVGFEGGDVNLFAYVGNNVINKIDPTGLSSDSYEPDVHKHGGPHIDRYNGSQNVGRYRPDGSGIPHKGKMPPPIPKKDMCKFLKAVKALGKLGAIVGIVLELATPANAGDPSDMIQCCDSTSSTPTFDTYSPSLK